MKSPLNITLKSEAISLILLIACFALSFYFYAHFPAQVPTHWDFQGNINGWSSAKFAAFFFPFFNLAIYLLLLFIPSFDPKKERYAEFNTMYNYIRIGLVSFLTIIYILISLVGLGYSLPIGAIVPAMVGLLFILLGYVMPKIKSNWTMGIRTPWTLSSETVWTKTHKLGGKMFILGGIIMAATAILPAHWQWFSFAVAIIIAALVPVIYSYIQYRKERSL